MTKTRDLKCRKCKKNDWEASYETEDGQTMLFLVCKCGHVWTAQLE